MLKSNSTALTPAPLLSIPATTISFDRAMRLVFTSHPHSRQVPSLSFVHSPLVIDIYKLYVPNM